MKGSVFKRCPCPAAELRDENGERRPCRKRHGSWWYNVPVPDSASGKTKQLTRGGFPTAKEAQRALTDLVSQINAGTWTDDQGMTVGQWLEKWLERKEQTGLRFSTLTIYRQHVRDYLTPALGTLRLKDLRPGHVSDLLASLQGTTGPSGKELSVSSILRIHACLRSALSTAQKMRLVSFNAARDVELPKPQRKRVRPWQPYELGAFLEHVRTDRLGTLFEILVASGLRRGEVLGLRWQDVDVATGTLTVAQQIVERAGLDSPCGACGLVHRGLRFGPVKTDAGDHRRVELDQYSAGVLLQQQILQDGERTEWGEAYSDHGLVFAREDGSPIRPSQVLRDFHRLTEQVQVPADPSNPNGPTTTLRKVRLHDLRHGSASLMLAAGVDMNVISKRLGHSRSSFTADTYAHMLDGVGREAAEKAAALIPRRSRVDDVR